MDIYAEITDRIIAELEQGIIPWDKPWTGVSNGAISRAKGEPYSLLNQMLLGKPGEYLTFDQCKREGGKVKKGAKSKMVVFWKIYPKQKTDVNDKPMFDSEGQPIIESLPILRYINVFHLDDCEGLKPKYTADSLPKTANPVEVAETKINDYANRAKLKVQHIKQDRAYYNPLSHSVVLPLVDQFKDTSRYYGVAFHELVHSTGHVSLLNRFGGADKIAAFGDESYSREELVAEIGSFAILHQLGLETPKSFQNNVAYIQSWLRALRNDKRLIVSAASRAEKAVKLILNQQDKATA